MGSKSTDSARASVDTCQQLAVALARSVNTAVGSYLQPALSTVQSSNLKGMQLLQLLNTGSARQARGQLEKDHPWCSNADVMIASARIRNIAASVEIDLQLNAVAELFRGVLVIEQKIEAILRLNVEEKDERELFLSVLYKLTPNALHQVEKYIRHQLKKADKCSRNLKQQMGAVLLAWRKLCLDTGLLVDIDVVEWKRRYVAHLMAKSDQQEGGRSDIGNAIVLLMDA